MRKILVALIIASLLSATAAAPAFANGWRGHSHGWGGGVNIFWPSAAALSIPAAIIGTVAQIAVPPPAGYGYGAPPAPAQPEVYPGPPTYYAPGPYYAPGAYYAPRVYVAPRVYYAPRPYYPGGVYRPYGSGW